MDKRESQTGSLFGKLWLEYDEKLFRESVELFRFRLKANNFDLNWFKGKKCLDAGCGGGRYSIAIAEEGASKVIGCDLSEQGIDDASKRAKFYNLNNLEFLKASVLDLPFKDNEFDMSWCAGVLHHTSNPAKGLRELARVTKKGGLIYLLLYGKGGIRWPLMMELRELIKECSIGYEKLNLACSKSKLPANKRRTFLDDLLVPYINFYNEDDIKTLLNSAGIYEYQRYLKAKGDHEESIDIQHVELKQLEQLYQSMDDENLIFKHQSLKLISNSIQILEEIQVSLNDKSISNEEAKIKVNGYGHSRIMCKL